jgi:hypothetical protein
MQENHPDWWSGPACVPAEYQAREFEETISDLSPGFVNIYKQSSQAESLRLDQLSGPGYRKALEFLVKDYLKRLDPKASAEIEARALGKCIGDSIKDPRIQSCAKRAAWLGNDETHYLRKWEEKDLKDLKTLLDLTVHWISADLLTIELAESMPDSGPAAKPATR